MRMAHRSGSRWRGGNAVRDRRLPPTVKPTGTTLQTHPAPAVLPPSLHPSSVCQVPPQPASAWVYAFPAVRVPLRPDQDYCERDPFWPCQGPLQAAEMNVLSIRQSHPPLRLQVAGH